MKKILGLALVGAIAIVSPVRAEQSLFLSYPRPNHTTTSRKIFLIGTAPPTGDVFINGQKIERSPAGHFAPSFPLEIGVNEFTLRHGDREIKISVTRKSSEPKLPQGLGFAEDSLQPAANLARMPGELICFSAIASANASVSVRVGSQTTILMPQEEIVDLPMNIAALIDQNMPLVRKVAGHYKGCTNALTTPGNLGLPEFQVSKNGQTITQKGLGQIEILSPSQFEIAEVTAEAGVARTGPSTEHTRLTPLPKGTRSRITGSEGEFVRLDYGGWIKKEETKTVPGSIPPSSIVRSLRYSQVPLWTEIFFPLQVAVPVTVKQGEKTLTLTLYNTTAETHTFRLDDDPVVNRMEFEQPEPGRVEYTFNFKSEQQWGYKLRYEGTTLVLSLRHPPDIRGGAQPLAGMKIAIDAGHGSSEDLGAVGPNGYPEKDVTLIVSKLLRDELEKRGATVFMTREAEEDLWPLDRVEMIEKEEPNLALSVHYNALPDAGDAINTAGIGMFWYHPQAHSLSVFLHNYLVQRLGRPSYGVFWNSLALARSHVTPSVLLELGFMINPYEFEWITNEEEQKKLAATLADGVVEWVRSAQ
ncbi:MAG: N-acetylmuramoyl-L-alanine amidase [Oscillatoria sp. SIO1A7]|nr:N-acetylmuramoyl-L-alanine amidase [Oscillatoria sp. SIO1A7]